MFGGGGPMGGPAIEGDHAHPLLHELREAKVRHERLENRLLRDELADDASSAGIELDMHPVGGPLVQIFDVLTDFDGEMQQPSSAIPPRARMEWNAFMAAFRREYPNGLPTSSNHAELARGLNLAIRGMHVIAQMLPGIPDSGAGCAISGVEIPVTPPASQLLKTLLGDVTVGDVIAARQVAGDGELTVGTVHLNVVPAGIAAAACHVHLLVDVLEPAAQAAWADKNPGKSPTNAELEHTKLALITAVMAGLLTCESDHAHVTGTLEPVATRAAA